ncbi:MAG: hypothetical protein AAF399_07720 [Bacteroidota bacterium]
MKKTAFWFIDNLLNELQLAFWNLAGHSFLFGFGGFLIGILLVIIAGKKRWLKRPMKLWTFVAGLNYVYLPILFGVIGGCLGVVKGIHATVDRYIDVVSEPAITYAAEYTGAVIAWLPEADWSEEEDVSVDVWITDQMAAQMDVEKDSYQYALATTINRSILHAAMDSYGVPREINHPMELYRACQRQEVRESMFGQVPVLLHVACARFFWTKYLMVWAIFVPFLIIPLAEFLLFLMVSLFRKAPPASPPDKREGVIAAA